MRMSDRISPQENMSIAQQLFSGQVWMEKWEVESRAKYVYPWPPSENLWELSESTSAMQSSSVGTINKINPSISLRRIASTP